MAAIPSMVLDLEEKAEDAPATGMSGTVRVDLSAAEEEVDLKILQEFRTKIKSHLNLLTSMRTIIGVIRVLRDISAEIAILLWKLGSSPIMQETGEP